MLVTKLLIIKQLQAGKLIREMRSAAWSNSRTTSAIFRGYLLKYQPMVKKYTFWNSLEKSRADKRREGDNTQTHFCYSPESRVYAKKLDSGYKPKVKQRFYWYGITPRCL